MKNLIIFCLVAFFGHAAMAQETVTTPAPAVQKKSCCAAGAAKAGAACSADAKAEASVTPTTAVAQTRGKMVKKTATTVASKLKTAQFMVLGNCGMCKKTIEKAAIGAKATTANWDSETDMLDVSFNAKKTSVEAIQKAVAKAGYDNAGYKAEDKAYNSLHGCCQYDRTGAAGGTKSCTGSK